MRFGKNVVLRSQTTVILILIQWQNSAKKDIFV